MQEWKSENIDTSLPNVGSSWQLSAVHSVWSAAQGPDRPARGSPCCVPRSILSYCRRSSGPRMSPQPHVLLLPAMGWVCHTWRASRSRNETVLSLTLGLTTPACPDHSVHSCLASPGSWPSGTATSSGIMTSRFLHGDTHIISL